MSSPARFRALAAALFLASCWAGSSTPAVAAGTYTQLYAFTGGADGAFPNASVTFDAAGNMYGETGGGGDLCSAYPISPNLGCGTVYKLSPAGRLTTLVTFNGPNGAVGDGKLALVGATLFGTTELGGIDNDGVVFSVNTDGTGFQIVHQFSGKDGARPNGSLIAKGKLLYGTAYFGGPYSNVRGSSGGYGVLFKIHQTGEFTLLHGFDKTDGENPDTIVMDAAGTIYGSTYLGGTATHCSCGTVFSYVPSTGAFTSLYSLPGNQRGGFPYLGSVDANGVLFGVTELGGKDNRGNLFQLAPDSGVYTFSVLHEFGSSSGPDGVQPHSGPTLLPNGSLVGSTYSTLYHYDQALPDQGADLVTFFYGEALSQPVIGPQGMIYGTLHSSGPNACAIGGGVTSDGSCGVIYSESR